MWDRLSKWFEHRTGYRKVVSALLIEHIPGGAKWRYVWGSCLAFVFSIQLVTGLLLMTSYSPGDSTAWSSVYFIQYQMDFGWLIRGLHHFGSQTMVVLLALHMLQVVIAGAHLPPREINWWLGLLLLSTVLALSLTGYLLPWDQKGYWATQVATNIAGNLPLAGPWLSKIIIGGNAYGHSTLTRFYTLHVGILPPLVIVLTALHLVAFRRHGVTAPRNADGSGWFWPEQAFRDLIVSLVIFGVMVTLVLWGDGHPLEGGPATAANAGFWERWAHAGQRGLGANLGAPADPSQPYPARPEWYFLFLFQLLKYFEKTQEIIGTVVIPNGVMVLLALLPLLGYGAMRRFGHLVGVLVVVGLLTGVACLTCLAVAADQLDPTARWVIPRIGTVLMPAAAGVLLVMVGLLTMLPTGFLRRLVHVGGMVVLAVLLLGSGALLYGAVQKKLPKPIESFVATRLTLADKEPPSDVEKFQQEKEKAEASASRAVTLAYEGVPEGGAVYLLRHDPLTRGPELFKAHCAGCHNYGNLVKDTKERKATASDLEGFGTEKWVRDLLREPGGPRFFGHTQLKSMTRFVAKEQRKAEKNQTKEQLEKDFDAVAHWLGTHPQRKPEKGAAPEVEKGFAVFSDRCAECHSFAGQKGESMQAPDFTGYGDADWLRLMLMMPSDKLRYGTRNAMPAFRDLEGPTAAVTHQEMAIARELMLKELGDDATAKKKVQHATVVGQLSDIDRELIIRWMVKDYRVVFGGTPISAVRKR